MGALRRLRNIGPMFRGDMYLPNENAAGGAVTWTRQAKRIVLNRKICIKPALWNCVASETSDTLTRSKLRGAMIKFLAEIFRGFHYMVGISAPPPGTSDRTFWLGAIKEKPSV